jgi:hypothetical protein
MSRKGCVSTTSILMGISSLLRKFTLIPEICSKQVRIYLRFKATLGSFLRNNKVSSTYWRLTIPPGRKLG